MASAITLKGIDRAVSQLGYTNENTLKYRFIQYIRNYYVDDHSLASLNKIDHTSMIKLLWDTHDDPEIIKNKKKNLNSLRSSVNADFKKLYKKGLNPEGIKIGSDNIFVMSEDAKDTILNSYGYDLQPDVTLKIDQIMDILKLASQTVSGALGVEDTTTEDGLRKKDQLKDLIKGLLEKLGLGDPEYPKPGAGSGSQPYESQVSSADIGNEGNIEAVDEDKIISETADNEDEELLEEVADFKEDEILDDIEDADEEDILDDVDEDILDDVEDIITDVTEDSDPEMNVEEETLDEDIEDVTEADTGLEYVDVEEDVHVGGDVAGKPGDESGTGKDEEEKEIEQLGLPVDSFGEDFETKKGTKLKKERLLAEAFDGYLGSMDRYYNHYILISGGEYSVGSRYPKKDEKPEQIVRLNPFYLGRFPVTNGLFEIFVEKTGYRTTAEKVGNGTVYYGRFEKKIDSETGRITSRWNASLYCKVVKGACWYHPTGPESTIHNKRNHPVVQISLEDAAAFAAWTGKRLPTENEWEAASRTANGWIFPWGEEWKNDACNIEESGIADTTPVNKYIEFENDFGIVDVLGNVLEWTSDGLKVASRENYETITQIAKGGSWVSGNDICLYSRFKIAPDSYSNVLGFRCVAY